MKKKTSKTKTSRKNKGAVLASVTSKTQDEQLKRALSRFKKRQTKTELFDHALPLTTLFAGIVQSKPSAALAIQQIGDQELSPFVLQLGHQIPSPEQLLEEDFVRVRLNLLHGRTIDARSPAFFHAPDSSLKTKDADDLALSQSDIHEQVAEEMMRTRGWSRLSLPLSVHPETIPRVSLSHIQPFLTEDSLLHEPLRADAFIPAAPPEDVLSFFDLPEDEEEQKLESEIVTLEEIETQVETEPEREPAPKQPRFSWRLALNLDWLMPTPVVRGFVSFLVLSFIVVLPLQAMNVVQELRETKNQLAVTSEAAVSFLSSGAESALARDGAAASKSFQLAGEQFDSAAKSIDALGLGTSAILAALPSIGSDYRSGKALVEAGKELSIAGTRIAEGLEAMNTELNPTPVSRLSLLEMYLRSALPHLTASAEAFEKVDINDLPEQHRKTFLELTEQLPSIQQTIGEFLDFYELANIVLGGEGTQRYLLVFQNNTEIRPTGGFIGSFAELKIRDGVIEELSVPGGGSYDLQGSMRTKIIAPEPLQLLSARWEFQDGNWFPDFPTTARQLLQFYRDAGGPTVDGVIAVNATYIAKLIGMLGPIDMPEYGRVIDEENFIFETQRIVELEYDKEENRPKAFIGDLAPLLMERALEQTTSDFIGLLSFADQGLSTKDVQLYFSDDAVQREVLERGWGGALINTDSDYLMVVDTNLGGGKTDGVIEQDIDLHVQINADGSIINTVTIKRTHHGIQGLLFTGVNNVDYLRVYVPKGSEFISAEGFSAPDSALFEEPESTWLVDDDLHYAALSKKVDPFSETVITQEHGKTVFGNWVQTKPGTTSTVSFTYRLPARLNILENEKTFFDTLQDFIGLPSTDQYTLTIQKQSGVLDRTTTVRLSTPEEIRQVWSSHGDNAFFTNETDAFYGVLLEH